MSWSDDDFFDAFKEAGMLDEAEFTDANGKVHCAAVGFNRPDALLLNEMVQVTQFQIEYEAGSFPGLKSDSIIKVKGKEYSVQGKPMALGNGSFIVAGLNKI